MSDPRLVAIRILEKVLPADNKGRSLREVLAAERPKDAAAAGLVTDLAFGVCRHYRFLNHYLDRQMSRPIKASALRVRLGLLCGLYELWFSTRPAYAVVNAWPENMRKIKAPWAVGLSNALLRKASQTSAALQQQALPPALAYSLPDWLWQQWVAERGEAVAEQMARASLAMPPFTVRCHRQRCTREQAIETLVAAGFSALPGDLVPYSLYVSPAAPVDALPGFAQGCLSVQDEAAQVPVECLELRDPAGRILDACSAPGGKTGQLAERFPVAHILALDVSASRLKRVSENLTRLGVDATLCCGDATCPASWWDGESFDGILLDAPCSATGILRRQPDVKWHRRSTDIHDLVGLQLGMLSALWPLLKEGGMLVYATCSTLRAENDQVVASFLQHQDDALEDRFCAEGAIECAVGYQWLPTEDRHDGFYVARIRKQAVR